ncbi:MULTISPECIES: YbjO family protein [Sodalis]|uniref:YbjO family protein n=1 Tax=Sodalis TaxID=84565 RepID=UPI0031F9EEC6
MSEILRNSTTIGARPRVRVPIGAPVAVMIAGIALITIRCLDVVLLFNAFGVNGMHSFVSNSSRAWDLTGLFLASLTMVFIEIRCGFGVMRAVPWTRWCYLGCQMISALYLFFATWRGFYPEMFMLPGDSAGQISYEVLMLKLPDLLIIALLFGAPSSRRFFARRR